MMSNAVNVLLDSKKIGDLAKHQQAAFAEAMAMTLHDLEQSETIPYETGILQDETTALVADNDTGRISIVSDTPYAARLYFHPEYRFQTDMHKSAGPYWFEPYIGGEKKDFILTRYARLLKQRIEGGGD